MIWNCDHKMGQSRQKHNYYIFYGKVKIPTYFYKRYYWKQNIVQPRGYDYLPFFKKEIPFFLIKDVEKAKTVITKLKIHQNHRRFIQTILAKERRMLIWKVISV